MTAIAQTRSRRPFVVRWLLTTDHKRIGLLYLFSITGFFFLGGLFALLVRLELLTPAADLMTPADGGKLDTTDEGDFKCFRTEYTIESDGGNVQVVNYAKANDKTGTLYFVSWQSPQAEQEKLAPLREKILTSMKFDPAF